MITREEEHVDRHVKALKLGDAVVAENSICARAARLTSCEPA
jgi:hypothetical protein